MLLLLVLLLFLAGIVWSWLAPLSMFEVNWLGTIPTAMLVGCLLGLGSAAPWLARAQKAPGRLRTLALAGSIGAILLPITLILIAQTPIFQRWLEHVRTPQPNPWVERMARTVTAQYGEHVQRVDAPVDREWQVVHGFVDAGERFYWAQQAESDVRVAARLTRRELEALTRAVAADLLPPGQSLQFTGFDFTPHHFRIYAQAADRSVRLTFALAYDTAWHVTLVSREAGAPAGHQ